MEKHKQNVGIVCIEASGTIVFFGCLLVVHCVLFRHQKETLFLQSAIFFVLFSFFRQFSVRGSLDRTRCFA